MTSSFHDTRWTLVSRSRGADTQAKAALSELCAAYYRPVVAFLCREGRSDDAARELAHDFFARLLASGSAVDGADAARGSFRSYLLGAVKHFAADQHDKSVAQKRGGGVRPLSLDATRSSDSTTSAPGIIVADDSIAAPDREFDRQWALTLLARALDALETEMRKDGGEDTFSILKPWLTGDAVVMTQAEAGALLGMSEGAVKVAAHRLRKRFREIVKAEIAQTVGTVENVRVELTHLLSVLGR